ncbi:uncharacterized protein CDAR_507691 [Caerostris darwini]|uniref:Uncharacterized protein n=1 Tax=Caerostris darwini TaxID=1538125 RepID=A0AAV4U963_9ARAC|nr:uncharacterized protein CDAR_507691 [Caerostris darwini]
MNLRKKESCRLLTCPDLPRVDLRTARYVLVPEHLDDLVVEEGHEEEGREVEEEDDEQLVDLGVLVAPGVGAVGEVVRLHPEAELRLVSMTMASGSTRTSEVHQMMTMAFLARLAVLLNWRGWQMAYQRSMEMKVRVSTDTDTETLCKGR